MRKADEATVALRRNLNISVSHYDRYPFRAYPSLLRPFFAWRVIWGFSRWSPSKKRSNLLQTRAFSTDKNWQKIGNMGIQPGNRELAAWQFTCRVWTAPSDPTVSGDGDWGRHAGRMLWEFKGPGLGRCSYSRNMSFAHVCLCWTKSVRQPQQLAASVFRYALHNQRKWDRLRRTDEGGGRSIPARAKSDC